MPLSHDPLPRQLGNPRFRAVGSLLLAVGCVLFAMSSRPFAQAPVDWKPVKVPEVWKNPPAGEENLSWYRGFVQAPADWKGNDLELFVEPVDAAHEVYFNGKKVGNAGEFPPFFRSGLAGTDRFFISADTVRYDAPNVVALRVYNQEGRTGFNAAPPVLFGGKQAIRMAGDWQFRPGDNAAFANFDGTKVPAGYPLFSKLEDAAEVAKTLKRIDDAGPQSPAEALKLFTVPSDLEIELAVGEPDISQPLSIKWDTRGRLWVNEFIQYPDPAGLKMVARDKFLRSVYDKVPAAPPNHFKGLDRISFHEDVDGDGKFDKHGVFVEGLSLTSSFAFDKDGLWVLQPPYLLFYPDKNHDDIPDGDPVVHLEGFGMEDSHSIANSLRWGPDGWLYGAQGSTVTGVIRAPGVDPAKAVRSLGQCIWRYHPISKQYEIFGEGGGNAFGLEIDAHGRIYSGHNGGNTRGFHYVQGGYYRKGFEKHGSLSNPYAFGFFENMTHDNVPRFTHQFIIYEGARSNSGASSLPVQYHGQLFGVGPLQGHVVRSDVFPDRSSLKTKDVDHPVVTKDTWFRPVDIQVGPDGAIYVADLYEQRIDHSSHYQGRIDREHGRVWRLKRKGGTAIPPFDLGKSSTDELIDRLTDANRWFRETALLMLAWKQPGDGAAKLLAKLEASTDDTAVAYLWGLYRLGGLTEPVSLRLLKHGNPYVRLWTIRLSGDTKNVSPEFAAAMKTLAYHEQHAEVRSQLACSIRRLPGGVALPIVSAMLRRDDDAGDIHIPLLLWWAIEAHAETDREAVLALFADPAVWGQKLVREQILERTMRRYALAGTRKDLLACATLLSLAPDADRAKLLLAGFEKAYEGRSLAGLPDELIAAIAKAGGGSLALRLRQGDSAALEESLNAVASEQAPKGDRLKFLQILAEIHPPSAVNVLQAVVKSTKDPDLQSAALGALQSYDDPKIGEQIVMLLPNLSEIARPTALNVLASRKSWARSLLNAVDAGQIAPRTVPVEIVQRILFQRDDQIAAIVEKHFGSVKGATTAEMLAQVDKFKETLSVGTGSPYNGRKLYLESCGKCHVLFEEGGRIGPELTGYKRDDLHTMLVNVVNPSAQIREGFEAYTVVTKDGRTLSGFIADQDARVVVLKFSDGQSRSLRRDEIDEMAASPQSMMPEGLLKNYTDQQVRDLFAYLRATQPLATR
ncbi:MAG: c-type cytochrome [Planctomycetota bacterium]|nr:c-type cytochrome [Planctomycetota bacterium]